MIIRRHSNTFNLSGRIIASSVFTSKADSALVQRSVSTEEAEKKNAWYVIYIQVDIL